MKKLLKQSLIFIFIPLLLVIHNFVADPFDYFDSDFRLSYNRMEKTRKFDIATWTLSEMNKIPNSYKKKVKIITVGDSRGQAILTNGFRGGWKKRMLQLFDQDALDLCFGSALPIENISLLKQELNFCPDVKTVYFFVSHDRFINGIDLSNRIENSVIDHNRQFPAISYLFNLENITTYWKGFNDKTLLEMNQSEIKEAENQIIKDYSSKYTHSGYPQFKSAWKAFSEELKSIEKAKKLKVILVIPPYEPSFLQNNLKAHHAFIDQVQNEMSTSGFSTINLQANTDKFTFIDAAHCNLQSKYRIEDLLTKQK